MIIETKNLTKTFGSVRAVDDLSFSMESGRVYGFIGPNGAGKTTTMRIMSTMDVPDSGDVLFDGVSCVEYPEKVRHFLGYMPDSLPEDADIKVWEYIDFFARIYGLKGKTRTGTIKHIEEFTGLGELREKFIKSLSKGMKQRVCLARALVHDPSVLIMDEPAAGLDPHARIELKELVKILARQGKCILISSHILTELEDMCDSAVIIGKGRLLRAGTLEEIRKRDSAGTAPSSVMRFIGPEEETLQKVLSAPFVESARISGRNTISMELSGDGEERAQLIAYLCREGCKIVEFRNDGPGLEDLFINITKNGDK
jgi:ABC-2 type transport system ATP-binding protein